MRAALALIALSAACAHAPLHERSAPIAGRVLALDGAPINLGSLRGRPTLVLTMTTWANPALIEAARFTAAKRRYGDTIDVLAIALDERPEPVLLFARTFDVPYRVVLPEDREAFVGARGPLGAITIVPTSALLDASGRVIARVEGVWPPGELDRAIERALAGDPQSR